MELTPTCVTRVASGRLGLVPFQASPSEYLTNRAIPYPSILSWLFLDKSISIVDPFSTTRLVMCLKTSVIVTYVGISASQEFDSKVDDLENIVESKSL